MSHILVTGGTGFIGKALTRHLLAKGKRVWVLTRHANEWRQHETPMLHYVDSLDAIEQPESIEGIINLAGEPLDAKRWNARQKQRIIDSRVRTTEVLVDWAEKHQLSIPVWINGSAIGWYGPQGDEEPLNEKSCFTASFSHDLCEAWEQSAVAGKRHIQRLVTLRIGIVLENDGGPLAAMLLPFKLGLGGRMGTGKQVWSWIHRADLIRLIDTILEDPRYSGPVNAVAPGALSQYGFAKALAAVLRRPCIAPMPALIAQVLLGEFAKEVLLQGQRVTPAKASELEFRFQYPELRPALRAILS